MRLSDAGHAYGLAPRLPVLSLRERDVLTLVTDGCGNSEIAGRLFVSPSTVKHHVAALLDKLGVDNRVQAATFATREGLGSLNVPFNETVNVRAIARTHHAKAGSAS